MCELNVCMFVPVGGEVMTGAFASMSLINSWVILSSSSTSLMFRGTPPPGMGTGAGGEGCLHKNTHARSH